jgi:glycerol-1-phosphate dehydrogenase [NAD(P)+]
MTSYMQQFPLPNLSFSAMDQERIAKALNNTRVIWLSHVNKDPLGALNEAGLNGKPLVVADENTLNALQSNWGETEILSIPTMADATQTLASEVQNKAAATGAKYLVAVGTGTINDLCKFASTQLKIPYAVIPTGPTMNGFVSATASISIDGVKHTLPATMPHSVLCDADLLARAPAYMFAAGFGDAIARFTAQTDWYMSHLMLETPYDPLPFALQAPLDEELALSAAALGRGDPDAVKTLMNNLLVSGLSMVISGSSAPASQSEHMIAHTLDLSPRSAQTRMHKILHGEQIAITTLSMSLMQRIWLESPTKRWLWGDWKRRARDRYWAAPGKIAGYFGPQRADEFTKEFNKKMVSDRSFEQLLGRFGDKWDTMRGQIESTVPRWTPRQLHQMLQAVGCKTNLGYVGWHAAQYNAAMRHAHFYRNRWTFLDLAYFFGPDRN